MRKLLEEKGISWYAVDRRKDDLPHRRPLVNKVFSLSVAQKRAIHGQIVLGRREWWLGAGFDWGGEDKLTFSLHIPFLINLYISPSFLVKKAPYEAISTDILWHDDHITINLWHEDSGYNPATDRYRHMFINLTDLLLGRAKLEKKLISEKMLLIVIGDDGYVGKGRKRLFTYKRPRWFKDEVTRIDIDIPDGIPFPNDKDYGGDTDKTFSFGCAANTYQEAMAQLALSILKERGENDL